MNNRNKKGEKPKGRGGEGRGSSRIDSLVITFKVLGLDQADQEDDMSTMLMQIMDMMDIPNLQSALS